MNKIKMNVKSEANLLTKKTNKPENDYFRALEMETHCYYL